MSKYETTVASAHGISSSLYFGGYPRDLQLFVQARPIVTVRV